MYRRLCDRGDERSPVCVDPAPAAAGIRRRDDPDAGRHARCHARGRVADLRPAAASPACGLIRAAADRPRDRQSTRPDAGSGVLSTVQRMGGIDAGARADGGVHRAPPRCHGRRRPGAAPPGRRRVGGLLRDARRIPRRGTRVHRARCRRVAVRDLPRAVAVAVRRSRGRARAYAARGRSVLRDRRRHARRSSGGAARRTCGCRSAHCRNSPV